MASDTNDHYSVLGLAQTATQADIRARFRELARKNHPDIDPSPEALERFKRINEANRVLSDANRRKTYDAEQTLARLRSQPAKAPSSSGSRATRAPSAAAPPAGAPAPSDAASILVSAAQTSFGKLKLHEAEGLCKRALKLDRRCAGAYELLGDIQRAGGRTDEAIAMYSYALQIDRTRREAAAKLNKLTGGGFGPVVQSVSRTASASPRQVAETRRRALMNGLGICGIGYMAFSMQRTPHPVATGYSPIGWSGMLVFALVIAGALAGLMLTVNNRAEPLRSALVLPAAKPSRRHGFAALLLGLGAVWFYAAVLLYTLVSVMQEAPSRSIGRAFAATVLVVLLFAAMRQEAARYLALFAGNVVFLAVVAGWALGDTIRPDK